MEKYDRKRARLPGPSYVGPLFRPTRACLTSYNTARIRPRRDPVPGALAVQQPLPHCPYFAFKALDPRVCSPRRIPGSCIGRRCRRWSMYAPASPASTPAIAHATAMPATGPAPRPTDPAGGGAVQLPEAATATVDPEGTAHVAVTKASPTTRRSGGRAEKVKSGTGVIQTAKLCQSLSAGSGPSAPQHVHCALVAS